MQIDPSQVNDFAHLPIFRFLWTGRFGRVIITAKDADENLLRTSVWKELRLLDDIIQNTTVEYDGDVFSYRQICARWEGECYTNDILNIDYILPEVMINTTASIVDSSSKLQIISSYSFYKV